MMINCKMIVFFGYIFMFGVIQAEDEEQLRALVMPDVHPTVPNEYLCTAFKIPGPEFIVEFLEIVATDAVHHLLVFGCENPGLEDRDAPRLVWNCNEQSNDTEARQWSYINGPTCAEEVKTIFNTRYQKLPEGVGYQVGEGTGINYLVLQIHYLHVEKLLQGETDNTGVVFSVLPFSSPRITKTAGIYILGTAYGTIMPYEKENFETACRIEEQVEIHPIAFYTHTHDLGLMVSGFKIDRDGNWHLIGKMKAQKMKMFSPVEDPDLTISYGDMIAARCTMYNFRDVSTSIGETSSDEMCNFYMLYWVDRDHPMKERFCFSDGPQLYSWELDINIDGVPVEIDLLASEE